MTSRSLADAARQSKVDLGRLPDRRLAAAAFFVLVVAILRILTVGNGAWLIALAFATTSIVAGARLAQLADKR